MAQTDSEFWFAAPDISASHADEPIFLVLTGGSTNAEVDIYIRDMSIPELSISLPANSQTSIDLTNYKSDLENLYNGTTPQDKSLRIVSTNGSGMPVEITAYYEVRGNNGSQYVNGEVWALKGSRALGRDFYVPGQQLYTNADNDGKESITIVATQNNTSVTIDIGNLTSSIVNGGWGPGQTITIQLDRGETFVLYDDFIATGWPPTGKSYTLAGTHVSADNPIAITYSDDNILFFGGSYPKDVIGDQLVPSTLCGIEYVVVNGNTGSFSDDIQVVAITDNTEIFLDGVQQFPNLNAGGLKSISLPANEVRYITATQPIYVYQITGDGKEMGSAILPSICEGSSNVSFKVSADYDEEELIMVVDEADRNNFSITPGSVTLPAFTQIGTTSKWYLKTSAITNLGLAKGTTYTISNSTGKFQFGTNIKLGSSAMYGYFSNFSSLNLGPDIEVCEGDNVYLDAGTDIEASLLRWYFRENTSDPWTEIVSASGTNSMNFEIDGVNHNFGYYKVEENGGCARSEINISEGPFCNMTPFVCDERAYLSTTNTTTRKTQLNHVTVSGTTPTFNPIGAAANVDYNAIGYNAKDNFIYGFDRTNDILVKIDADGKVQPIYSDLNLSNRGFGAAAFDTTGAFYLTAGSSDVIKITGISSGNPTSSTTTFGPHSNDVYDFAFSPLSNDVYYINSSNLYKYNLNAPGTETLIANIPEINGGVTAMWFDSFGTIDVWDNNSNFYSLDTNGNNVRKLPNGPPTGYSDGCSCANYLDMTMESNPSNVTENTDFNYILKISNATKITRTSASLSFALPENVTYRGPLSEDLNGTVTVSTDVNGIETIEITNATIPVNPSITTINIPVTMGCIPSVTTTISAQASLTTDLGTIQSDDPNTYTVDDATETDVTDVALSATLGTAASCKDSPITQINYSTTNATGIGNITDFPPGLSATFNSGTGNIEITGTPTIAGTYNYSIDVSNSCETVTENGIYTVKALPSITGITSNER